MATGHATPELFLAAIKEIFHPLFNPATLPIQAVVTLSNPDNRCGILGTASVPPSGHKTTSFGIHAELLHSVKLQKA